jgi:hypothetical protein
MGWTVIAVAQLVNKMDKEEVVPFSTQDVQNFLSFEGYAAASLRNMRLFQIANHEFHPAWTEFFTPKCKNTAFFLPWQRPSFCNLLLLLHHPLLLLLLLLLLLILLRQFLLLHF